MSNAAMFGLIWLGAALVAVFFNYACSKVSGNHLDPHRDEGQ